MSFIKFQNVVLDNVDPATLEISGNFSLGSSVNSTNYLKIGPWKIKSVGAVSKYFNSDDLVAQYGDNGPSYSMVFKY